MQFKMFESSRPGAKRPKSLIFEPVMSDTDSSKSEPLEDWDTWEPALSLLEAADNFITWNEAQEINFLETDPLSAWNFKQAFTTPEKTPDASPNALPVTIPNCFPSPSTPSETHCSPAGPLSPFSSSVSPSVSRGFYNSDILGDGFGSPDSSVSAGSPRTPLSFPAYKPLRSHEPSPTSPKSSTYISPSISESYLYPEAVPVEIAQLYHMAHRVATQAIGAHPKLTPYIASDLAKRLLKQAESATGSLPRPELAILLPRLFGLLADVNASSVPNSARDFAAAADVDTSWKYKYQETDSVVKRVAKRIMRARREGRVWMQFMIAVVVLMPLFWEVFVKTFPRNEGLWVAMD